MIKKKSKVFKSLERRSQLSEKERKKKLRIQENNGENGKKKAQSK